MNDVEKKIIVVRNQQVIVDSDVATLYGVSTKEINQAVKNNPEKFPDGYIFPLTFHEKCEVVKNFDHLQKLKFSKVLPMAFTERGLYMLATILKGKNAVKTTLEIVDTFVKIRELSRTVMEIPKEPDEVKQKSLMKKGGELISELIGSGMETSEAETEIELNFAMLKIRHKVKKKV